MRLVRRSSGTPRAVYVWVSLACGVALAVAAVEILLRVVPIPAVEIHRRGPITQADHRRFFVYDAELGWRGRPYADGPFSGWEFSTQVRLNELGFRDAGPWKEKVAGQFELIVLGDSITWGFGVEEGRRYSDRLAGELSKQGLNVLVKNVAVNGYDTGQEWLLYRQLRSSHCPDLVLIGLYGNDLPENSSALQGHYPKPFFEMVDGEVKQATVPAPSEQDRQASEQSKSTRSVLSGIRETVRTYALAAWIKELIRHAMQSDAAEAVSYDEQGIEITATLLRRLATDVESDGSHAAVMVLPDRGVSSHAGASPASIAAVRSGLADVLDLRDTFQEAGQAADRPLFYRFDGAHWTNRAHELAARAIVPFVMRSPAFRKAPRQCAKAGNPAAGFGGRRV